MASPDRVPTRTLTPAAQDLGFIDSGVATKSTQHFSPEQPDSAASAKPRTRQSPALWIREIDPG